MTVQPYKPVYGVLDFQAQLVLPLAPNPPLNPIDGSVYADTDDKRIYMFYNGQWRATVISAVAGEGVVLTVAETGITTIAIDPATVASQAELDGHTHPSVTDHLWVHDTLETIADPGSGDVRSNTGQGIPFTQLAFSKTTSDGQDVTELFKSLTTGDLLYFQQKNDANSWGRYTINAPPTNNTTWFQVATTHIESHGGPIPKLAEIVVRFTYGTGGGGGGFDKAAADALYVKLTGTETIDGYKTFLHYVTINENLLVEGEGGIESQGRISATDGIETNYIDVWDPPTQPTHAVNKESLDPLLAAKQSTSEKNVANGYAGLGASGKVSGSQLPANFHSGGGPPGAGIGALGDYYTDTAGGSLYGPKASYGPAQSLYTGEIPAYVSGSNDTGSFGHDVTFNKAGRITGLRVYRPATVSAGTTTMPLHVWNSSGVEIATCATSNESAAGWYVAPLATPLAVTAAQLVRISYDLNPPRLSMSRTPNTLHTLGDLTLGTAYSRFGSYARPTSVENYLSFVDVVFETTLSDPWSTAVSAPPHTCILQKIYNQTINNVTWTALEYDYEESDSTGDMHSTSSNKTRVYVRRTGMYLLTATIAWAPNSTGDRYTRFAKNGTTAIPGRIQAPATAGGEFSLSRPVQLTAGDYVEVQVYQGSGGGLAVTGGSAGAENNPHFAVVEIR